MAYDFSGKRALVTGASTGFGRATALRLSKLGADVVALCIQEDHLKTLQAEDPKITTVYCDLRNWEETERIVKSLRPIHLLVNNAGILEVESLLTITPESFDRTFSVNLKAILNVSQVVASDLIAKKQKGVIVNIASEFGIRPLPNIATYSASKAGVISLTKSMAIEFSPKGIRANAVCPAPTMTAMGIKGATELKFTKEMVLARMPIGTHMEIKNVVDAVIFLLSEQSEMVNGSCVPVDGGALTL